MEIAIGSAAVSLPLVDVAVLSRAARVEALRDVQRARAWADAAEARLLASLGEPGEVPRLSKVSATVVAKQYEREEIACALRLSPLTVNNKLHVARTLVSAFPATLAVLETGQISMRHARLLVEATEPLSVEGRGQVEAAVLGTAMGQTPSRFGQTVTRAVLAADPRGGDERHETAREERRVQVRMLPEAMGSLYAVLPAADLQAVAEVIRATADAHPAHTEHCARITGERGLDRRPDPGCAGCVSRARTADQRRADALVGVVTGLDPEQVASRHGRRPAVQVSVALSTLLGLDEQPGELDGYGPIPADVARRMAADPSGTWRRLITDPTTGRLLDYGRSTYRPPQDLTDYVIARDRICRFPGCNRQARTCELDHLHEWELGGHTAAINVLAGCTRHHHLGHDAGWTVTGTPEGTLTWTTPTGHAYDTNPGTHPVDHTTDGTIYSGTIDSGTTEPDDPDPPPF